MKEFIVSLLFGFSLFALAESSYNSNRKLDVSVPFVLCRVEPHPSPSTALMDCRYKDGAGYSGQKGFVYKGESVHALVVDVYNSEGRKKGMRFVKKPPKTLRYYLSEEANTDPWLLKHKNLRSILGKGDRVKIVKFQLDGLIKVYEDSGFRFPKKGSVGSKIEFSLDSVVDSEYQEVLKLKAGEEHIDIRASVETLTEASFELPRARYCTFCQVEGTVEDVFNPVIEEEDIVGSTPKPKYCTFCQ